MIETLLGQWLEEVRASHRETVLAAAKACGISSTAWLNARVPGPYIHARIRRAFAQYLGISEAVVEQLYQMPGDPDYRSANLSGPQRTRPRSRLAIEVDAACRRRGSRKHEVAVHLGFTASYISHLCILSATAPRETWEKLAAVLLTTPEQVAAWAQEPAPETGYPRATWVGTKYHPTVRINGRISCETCPFRAECERDVKERDGFAWCEELIPVDLDPDHVTVSREAIGESYV